MPMIHRSAAVVARTEGDLFFYALGTGEYDELSCEFAMQQCK